MCARGNLPGERAKMHFVHSVSLTAQPQSMQRKCQQSVLFFSLLVFCCVISTAGERMSNGAWPNSGIEACRAKPKQLMAIKLEFNNYALVGYKNERI